MMAVSCDVAQRHQVRKAGEGENSLVAVFLTFSEKHLLLLYRPSMVQGQLSLTHLKTLYPPQVSWVPQDVTVSILVYIFC